MDRCQHYWVLEAPQADIVRGRCKRCQEERAFPSRLDETDRGNDHEYVTRPARAAGLQGCRAAGLQRVA